MYETIESGVTVSICTDLRALLWSRCALRHNNTCKRDGSKTGAGDGIIQ